MKKLSLLVFLVLVCVTTAQASLSETIDQSFAGVVGVMASFLFWNVPLLKMPLIVVVLAFGALYFTVIFRFINFRAFRHAIDVVRGKYDNPQDSGEVSHFQALASALSATVGLGNIAGVAVAVGMGGPGAVFWMWAIAFFGMTSKFYECTMAQAFRKIDPKTGVVKGGPMYYMKEGLPQISEKLGGLGKVLAVLFAFLCIGGSLGGANLFQSNQTFEMLKSTFPGMEGKGLLVGGILAFFSALVIIGGIKRIGKVTSRLVPFMCGIYAVVCVYILVVNFTKIPGAFGTIIGSAFSPEAGFGGFLGVLIQGVKRGVFSNEAGIGSASIAHAAAKTDEPVREGIVALLEPFIDTIVVCTMTALVVVITGVYTDPAHAGKGVAMTSAAFASVVPWFPYFLTFAVGLFAFSTVISWSYYGVNATQYLVGEKYAEKGVLVYKVIFISFVAIAPVLKLSNVIDFSDLMILGMAFPNIIALVILSKKGKALLASYWEKLQAGEFKVYK